MSVASAADFGSRKNGDYLVYALEQRHGYETGTLAPDIAAEIEKLKKADLLILNFPVYWFSVPAMLKGWIDRVLVSGLCYGGMRFYDQGGLRGKKAALSFTLGGRPHMFGPDAIHGELDMLLRPLLRGTLAYVGMDVLPFFAGYHVPYLKPEAREQIMLGIGRRRRAEVGDELTGHGDSLNWWKADAFAACSDPISRLEVNVALANGEMYPAYSGLRAMRETFACALKQAFGATLGGLAIAGANRHSRGEGSTFAGRSGNERRNAVRRRQAKMRRAIR